MELITAQEAEVRQPPAPDSPTITVYFGGDEGGPDVGLLRVSVPVGARMGEHVHAGSDVILIAVSGRAQIVKGDEIAEIGPGDAVLVRKEEGVGLANPGDEVAELVVAAGPANFVAAVRGMPAPVATAAR